MRIAKRTLPSSRVLQSKRVQEATRQKELIPTSTTNLIFGHRGFSWLYPENTLLSFNKAIEYGAGGIECDVWKSSDGGYVVIHDTTVDRTTNESGAVTDYTLAELTAMDAGAWKGSEFAGREDTRIPSLDVVLDEFIGDPIFITLHIKLGYLDIHDIVGKLRSRGMLGQCFIFGSKSSMGIIKSLNPDAFVMNDVTNWEPDDLIEQAINEDWNAVSFGLNKITQQAVYKAYNSGLYSQVSTITSNFATVTQDMINIGVNFLLGDDVDTMVGIATQNNVTQITPDEI